jgi:hypothetical protein
VSPLASVCDWLPRIISEKFQIDVSLVPLLCIRAVRTDGFGKSAHGADQHRDRSMADGIAEDREDGAPDRCRCGQMRSHRRGSSRRWQTACPSELLCGLGVIMATDVRSRAPAVSAQPRRLHLRPEQLQFLLGHISVRPMER